MRWRAPCGNWPTANRRNLSRGHRCRATGGAGQIGQRPGRRDGVRAGPAKRGGSDRRRGEIDRGKAEPDGRQNTRMRRRNWKRCRRRPHSIGRLGRWAAGRCEDCGNTAREQLKDVVRALAPAGKQEEPAQNQAAGQLAELARDQRALLAKTSQFGAALAKVTGEDTPEAAEKAMYDQIKSPTDPLAKELAERNSRRQVPRTRFGTIPR